MSQTTNYNLELTDDATTTFKNWREAINGVSNSNMIKIDNALGEKADNSNVVQAILLQSAWSGLQPPFTQTITVSGLGENQNGTISIAHNATYEQREAAREGMLCVTGQSENTLTISADGEMPELDIPVVVILLG